MRASSFSATTVFAFAPCKRSSRLDSCDAREPPVFVFGLDA